MDTPYTLLAEAIIQRAIEDYYNLKATSMLESCDCNIEELEEFFRSDYFAAISPLDAEYILDAIKRRTANARPVVRAKSGRIYYVYELNDDEILTVKKGNH